MRPGCSRWKDPATGGKHRQINFALSVGLIPERIHSECAPSSTKEQHMFKVGKQVFGNREAASEYAIKLMRLTGVFIASKNCDP